MQQPHTFQAKTPTKAEWTRSKSQAEQKAEELNSFTQQKRKSARDPATKGPSTRRMNSKEPHYEQADIVEALEADGVDGTPSSTN